MSESVDILLVDDHEENLLALEAILTEPTYRLVRAHSGREALREVLKADFALILLDVAMPDLDGYETAELIRQRERSRDTPIIFLTANYRSEGHVFRGYSVGAVDYLFKPFSPEILQSKVAVFVELFLKREALKRHTQALQHAHDELEERVRARTKELADTNQALRAEIAERMRIERERLALLEREQAARANAESVNRMKDEFLATLSHELRTPLNAIMGWAHLLTSGKADAAMTERALSVIQNNALAQSQLIEDILDVSRIIGGKLRLNLGTVQLAEVVEAALDSVAPAAEAKGIRIDREIQLVEPILGDRDRLQQVIWNLLSNAVKFTPRDGRVKVRLVGGEGEVVVSVEDTGIGISPSFLPYVFDRFTQADGSATRRHGGLGLGMAIVRHLVELHGGTVHAHSDGENQGATFVARLPARIESTVPHSGLDDSGDPEDAPLERQGVLPHLTGVNILVVDDEADSRSFLCALLEEQGARVATASSAAEAFEAFSRARPDVLVSDIAMAGEDGYDLIRRVRQLDPNQGGETPAVALTAYVRGQDARAALNAGYHRHVRKPVVVDELIATLAELAASTANE
ncbi:MAG TPA: response regulator [Vicinamibacterales bacterium]